MSLGLNDFEILPDRPHTFILYKVYVMMFIMNIDYSLVLISHLYIPSKILSQPTVSYNII